MWSRTNLTGTAHWKKLDGGNIIALHEVSNFRIGSVRQNTSASLVLSTLDLSNNLSFTLLRRTGSDGESTYDTVALASHIEGLA